MNKIVKTATVRVQDLIVGDVLIHSGFEIVEVEVGESTVTYRRKHSTSPHVYASTAWKGEILDVFRAVKSADEM
jgi:hypothetical protein